MQGLEPVRGAAPLGSTEKSLEWSLISPPPPPQQDRASCPSPLLRSDPATSASSQTLYQGWGWLNSSPAFLPLDTYIARRGLEMGSKGMLGGGSIMSQGQAH